MEEKKNILTYEGLRRYEDELHDLKVIKRKEVAQQIKEAREQGDLSENAEYDAAKEAQGMLEMRISNLKAMVSSARMIDESKISTKEVQILTRVKIKNTKTEQIMTYMIVSESEANFKEGKLSVTTPIAKGLLGKKVGQKATVSVPNGQLEFEVMEITL